METQTWISGRMYLVASAEVVASLGGDAGSLARFRSEKPPNRGTQGVPNNVINVCGLLSYGVPERHREHFEREVKN